MNLPNTNGGIIYECYKLTWNVELANLRAFEIKSRVFELRKSATKWYMVLEMRNVEGSLRYYVQLCRSAHDNNREDIATRVSLMIDSFPAYEDQYSVFQKGSVLKCQVEPPRHFLPDDRAVYTICCLIGTLFQPPSRYLREIDLTASFERENDPSIDIITNNTLMRVHKGILIEKLHNLGLIKENFPASIQIDNYPPGVVMNMLNFAYTQNISSEDMVPPSEKLYYCADEYGLQGLVHLLQPHIVITRDVVKEHVHNFEVHESELSNFFIPSSSDETGNVFYKLRLTDCSDCAITCVKVTIDNIYSESRISPSIFTARNTVEVLGVTLEMPHHNKELALEPRGFSWINSTVYQRYVAYSFIPKEHFTAKTSPGSSQILLRIFFRLD